MRSYADVLLPITPFTETDGTFVNAEGQWQSFSACVKPHADSRPGWKVLRVLGNFLKLDGFSFVTSEEVRDELDAQTRNVSTGSRGDITSVDLSQTKQSLMRIGYIPAYTVDSLVRRAQPLQETADALAAMIALNKNTASKHGLDGSHTAVVVQSNKRVNLPIYIEDAIPDDCAFIPVGVAGSAELGISYGPIEVDAG
jgi:NADH-quinone oxidoreductase subunit G